MFPKLITIGKIFIPTYGTLVALGFLLGLWITVRLARRAKLPIEPVTNLAIYCALAGLVGAKLFMILFDFQTYWNDPRSLFSLATLQAVRAAGARLDEIDLFVYHQANGRILSAVADRLGVEHERVFDCIATLGNTSAASVPLALGEAVRVGALTPGATVVLGAVGAGVVWGATVMTWGTSP